MINLSPSGQEPEADRKVGSIREVLVVGQERRAEMLRESNIDPIGERGAGSSQPGIREQSPEPHSAWNRSGTQGNGLGW